MTYPIHRLKQKKHCAPSKQEAADKRNRGRDAAAFGAPGAVNVLSKLNSISFGML